MRRACVVGLSVVVIVAVAASISAASGASVTIVAAWTELGPNNREEARVVVSQTNPCPTLSLRPGPSRPMTVRAGPSTSFDDTVCDAPIPPGSTAAGVPGHPLPVASNKLRRIALVGDTGCANTPKKGQVCSDPNDTGWPFAKIASHVAAEHPDLIIHLGDILYRQPTSGCLTNGCSIDADFFAPAAPMLAAAPLVMVRGNHEGSGADCVGWFRYFAFGRVETCTLSLPVTCPSQWFTCPYRIRLTAHQEMIVLDTSFAPDAQCEPETPEKPESECVNEYVKELRLANALATEPAWLISHVPLWYVAKKGAEGGPGILEQALKKLGGRLSANFRMVISGHLHQFEYLSFSTQVPAQLILGNGGTKMSKPMPIIPCTAMIHPCTVIDNLRVLNGQAKDKFGYGMIQLENQDTSPADPKSITIRTDEGSTYKTCSLRGYMLRCSSPALPKTLGDLASGLA